MLHKGELTVSAVRTFVTLGGDKISRKLSESKSITLFRIVPVSVWILLYNNRPRRLLHCSLVDLKKSTKGMGHNNTGNTDSEGQ